MSSAHSEWRGQEAERGSPPLQLISRPTRYQTFVKPVLDRVLGAILFVGAIPFLLIGVVVVAVTLGRPVFYTQERVGKGGRRFLLYKLRTMTPDRRTSHTPAYEGPERRSTHKSLTDPRVANGAAWLRAVRFDELPQFWNVMVGDMSLVGPRPELPEIVDGYEDWQHRRHTVKPGLTGLWQVSAPEGKLMHECVDLDIEYIENLSLLNDLKILLSTPSAMLSRTGF